MRNFTTIILLSIMSLRGLYAQLLPVRNETLWGYADMKGKLKIDFQFHDANFFVEDMGRVRQNGLYGFIDQAGNWLIKNSYINAADFSDGLALVTDTNEQQFYINKQGEKVLSIPEGYSFGESFVNGFCKVSQLYIQKRLTFEDPRYHLGFMDKSGKIIIEPVYDDVSNFDEHGLARVIVSGKMGIINNQGKIVVKPIYPFIGPFNNGLALVQKGQYYGYINQKGKISIKTRFQNGGDFTDGLAPVMLDSLWGFIDSKGKVVIKPTYTYAESFSEGLAGVVISKKWGMINTSGQLIIRNIFQDYAPFREGRAAIKLKDQWGYIDKAGLMVVMPQYRVAGSFIDQVSLVEDEEYAIYINQNGTPIYKYSIKAIKRAETKRENYWNNVEKRYEKEIQEYNEYLQKKNKKK